MKTRFIGVRIWQAAALLVLILASGESCCAAELRLGIIGTDSSHAIEFTRILNDATAKDHVVGAHVVAAYRGGNPSFDLSRDRIESVSAQLAGMWHIPFVQRIRELCPLVDGLLLLSVDPQLREQEFVQASACAKPIFVDKPLASDLKTANTLAHYADAHHVAWFSASSMRFGVAQQLHTDDICGANVWGPGALRQSYALDLAWYGIHSIEMLYAVLGPGAQTVSRAHTQGSDVLTIVWKDGRTGVVHLVRPDISFALAVLYSDGHSAVHNDIAIDYFPLVKQIVSFMQNSRTPVPANETLEIFALMDAAQQSMQQHGVPIPIQIIDTIGGHHESQNVSSHSRQ